MTMSADPSTLHELIDTEADHAEAHRDDPIPATARGTRPHRAKSGMLSLRLNPDELTAIQTLARERDVPASALVRGWILQQLTNEASTPTDTATAVDRLEADVRALRKLVTS
jgi:hypothetical protein